jgi:hypothetical protein
MLTDITKETISEKIGVLFFYLVIVLLLLNVFTPLRLNIDGIRYLNILQYFEGMFNKNSGAAKDFFPHGYPWFLFLLDKLAILNPASICLINIISLLLACHILTKMLPVEKRWTFYGLVLLSFVYIKHATLPVSDPIFVLLFTSAIYFWSGYFNGNRRYILPCLIITAIAVYVRTVGIIIAPAIVIYIAYKNKKQLLQNKLIIYVLSFALFAAIILFIYQLSFLESKISYLQQLQIMMVIKEPYSIVERLLMHFKETGEIFLNVPYSKLAILNTGNFDLAYYLLIVVGIASLFISFLSAVRLKLLDKLIFWAFAAYTLMIFLWPFNDARFLMPIIPIIIYLVAIYLFKFLKSKPIKIGLLSIYITFGFASLVYSDALSLNKNFFLNHYGFDPQLTSDYRIHFRNITSHVGTKNIYNIKTDNALYLLDKYDK